MFSTLETNDSPSENIIFGDDSKGKVIGLGKVAISNDHSLSNVLLVESLNYNYYLYLNYVNWVMIACLIMWV